MKDLRAVREEIGSGGEDYRGQLVKDAAGVFRVLQ